MWVNSRCAIAAWLACFQEKPRTVSEWTGLPGEESVKRFERSNGLDTALYKTIPLPLLWINLYLAQNKTRFKHWPSLAFMATYGILSGGWLYLTIHGDTRSRSGKAIIMSENAQILQISIRHPRNRIWKFEQIRRRLSSNLSWNVYVWQGMTHKLFFKVKYWLKKNYISLHLVTNRVSVLSFVIKLHLCYDLTLI